MDKTPLQKKREAQLAYATYTVLRLISKGKSQKQIQEKLRINKSNSSRRCSVLLKQQLIVDDVRTTTKLYRLTKAGFYMMQQMRNVFGGATLTEHDFPLTFRWHHIIFKIPIIAKPPELQHLLQTNKFFYGRKAGFLYGWIKRIRGADVVVTGKSILIFPKPISAGSVNSAVIMGCDLIDAIMEDLTAYLPNLELASKTQICRQHCAMEGGITNFFPTQYHYESDRLIIDNSTGKPEIEGIHKTLAITDMQVISQFLETLIRGDEK